MDLNVRYIDRSDSDRGLGYLYDVGHWERLDRFSDRVTVLIEYGITLAEMSNMAQYSAKAHLLSCCDCHKFIYVTANYEKFHLPTVPYERSICRLWYGKGITFYRRNINLCTLPCPFC